MPVIEGFEDSRVRVKRLIVVQITIKRIHHKVLEEHEEKIQKVSRKDAKSAEKK